MALSQELLDILACPKCKGDLHLNDKQDGLVCGACSRRAKRACSMALICPRIKNLFVDSPSHSVRLR